MITNKDEAKEMVKHISRDCKCKFNSTTCNSNQKWNNENSNHLKCIADDSVIAWEETMYVMDIVSTNMTNTVPANMTNIISTNVSTNSDGKKVSYKTDYYILYTV